ncbi:hypothetical protein [Hymenobacter sp. BT190]|uniref:hypothetical protein n=1 Tax=Hymenobacter sp. BT190 TaxID=2763505 RepID=UPI0016516F14|nr:hypothetical protein [Hymenobacter sp. BT190]MBC6697431.1 hypothetical protein [Hymenobacter sp. BT190]
MKKVLFLLPLLALLVGSGCKKVNELLTFEISDSQNIKIPASGLVTPPFISPIAVPARSQENFKNNNTSADLVKDVSLTKLTLTITDPAAENFNFLRSIKISIGTDQNDKVPLAALDNVPMGVSSIELQSSNTKLDKYLKAPSYTLYTEVTLRGNVARELTLRSDSKFKVTADPL